LYDLIVKYSPLTGFMPDLDACKQFCISALLSKIELSEFNARKYPQIL